MGKTKCGQKQKSEWIAMTGSIGSPRAYKHKCGATILAATYEEIPFCLECELRPDKYGEDIIPDGMEEGDMTELESLRAAHKATRDAEKERMAGE